MMCKLFPAVSKVFSFKCTSFNPKSTGDVFHPPPHKIRSRHPRELKLTGLIAYIMFYRIMYHSKGIDESYLKMYFLLNLSHYVKSYGHFCIILAFLMMPTYQIWSCHVTEEANFEFFYFVLILHLILGKVTKFLVESSLLLCISQKNSQGGGGGWKTPPSAFRVKRLIRPFQDRL